MAEEEKKEVVAAPEPGSPEEQAANDAATKAKKKKLLLLGAVAGVLVLVGGGVGGYFMLGGKKKTAEDEHAKPVALYVDVPQFAVQIAGEGDQNHFMKLGVTLELRKPEDVEVVKVLLPRVQDDFNAFLLNLRVEDLRGSAGLQRVKDALLLRANQVLAPVVVANVLYKEVLVQ